MTGVYRPTPGPWQYASSYGHLALPETLISVFPYVVKIYVSYNGDGLGGGSAITTDTLPQAGDWLVVATGDSQNASVPTGPGGSWNSITITDTAQSGPFEAFLWSLKDPAQNTTYTWTLPGGRRTIVGLLIRNADPSTLFDVADSLASAVGSSHGTRNVTTAGTNRLVTAFAVQRSFPLSPWQESTGWKKHNETVGTDAVTNMTIAAYSQKQASAGTYSGTFVLAGTEPAIVITLAIRPAGGAADQTINANGIISSESSGAASAAVGVSPSGIPTSESVGNSTVSATYTINASGISSTENLGNPTLNLNVTPSSILSSESLGSPSITVVTAINASGIVSAERTGSPTISTTYTINANGIVSNETLGTPTIANTVTINASGATTAGQSGASTINLIISTSGIISGERAGTSTVTTNYTINTNGIASSEASGTATVQLAQSINANSVASQEALGSPTVTPGPVTISASGIVSSESVGNANTASVSTVNASGIVSSESVGSSAFSVITAINATGILSGEKLGNATVQATYTINANGIASSERPGTATLSKLVIAAGIISSEIFGKPAIQVGTVTISAGGVRSGEAFGTVTVTVLPLVAPEPDTIVTFSTSQTVVQSAVGVLNLIVLDSDTVIVGSADTSTISLPSTLTVVQII